MLGVKYVDFIMFNRHNAQELKNELPEIRKKFLTWKDQGLVKYAGVTCHKQMAECIDVAVNAGFFSCVMPTFGQKQFTEMQAQRDKLRQNKVSLMGMKTKGELNDQEYPAQIQRLLSDACVCSIIKGVKTISDLDEWVNATVRAKTGFWYRRLHENYAERLRYDGCTLCGRCQDVCPNGVAAADIVRCIRYYHDAERMPDMASWEFRNMGLRASVLQCQGCGACERACPQNIAVRHEIRMAGAAWA
jgi:predicted aldo/keto reductase-like oxidoreductase